MCLWVVKRLMGIGIGFEIDFEVEVEVGLGENQLDFLELALLDLEVSLLS